MRRASGVQLAIPDSALVARARAYLSSGPSDASSLISYVCQLPGAPPRVAEHMARALFDRLTDFACDECGRWMIAGNGAGLPNGFVTPTSLRLRDLRYVVVDVETTGTRAFGGDRITEFAAVRIYGGEIVDLYETLVNPERGIPAFITALTRITWGMVKDAPRFLDIAPRVSEVLQGQLFVAHNAVFDWRFVSSELERVTGGRLLGERLCTVRLARAFLPHLRRRSLDSLAHYFGVEIAARHRAGGDALATAHILLRLLSEAEGRGCMTLDDLRTATRTPPVRRRRKRRALPHASDGDFPA